MARYSRKRRSRRHSSIRRTDMAMPAVSKSDNIEKRAALRQASRSKTKFKGGAILTSFLRKNIKAVAIVGFIIIIGGITAGILLGGRQTAVPVAGTEPEGTPDSQMSAEPTDMPEEAFSEYTEEAGYNYDGVDESVLAGLTGSDDSLFSDDQEMEDAIFEAEGIRIGVTLGDIDGSLDELYLSKLEQTSYEYEEGRLVYEVYYYNAQGDFNQQLQDVRSLIKNEVDTIIVGNTTKEGFDMVTSLAEGAGIPVVAYNAPEGASGYEINIVPDDKGWGTVCGQFVAANLAQGKVLQVLGSENNEADVLRAAGISEALAANENIRIEDIIYAGWDEDDAHDAMADYLDEEGIADAVITEEEMAQGVLDAFIEIQKLPKVMCGDVSAGFIKKWYELKTKGIEITIEPEDDNEEPTTVILKSEVGEMTVLAQPAPVNIGAVAFEIAYKLSEGRTIKSPGETFVYSVETVITEDNLPEYYAMVMDQDDDYLLRDMITQETLESLLSPSAE